MEMAKEIQHPPNNGGGQGNTTSTKPLEVAKGIQRHQTRRWPRNTTPPTTVEVAKRIQLHQAIGGNTGEVPANNGQ